MSSYLYTTGGGRAGDPTALTNGESTVPRHLAGSSVPMSTGLLRLAYFTATKTETIVSVRVITSTTAAAATPTLIRIGIYAVAGNNDLTLVASTPNDTALLAAASTSYTKALSVPWSKVANTRYAAGLMVVTGVTAPTVYGVAGLVAGEHGMDPKLCGLISGADLPGSALAAGSPASSLMPYIAVVP